MTTRMTLRRINPWRVAMVAIVAVMGLVATASPAHAHHWYLVEVRSSSPDTDQCWAPNPPDPGGCAAEVVYARDGSYGGYAVGWLTFQPFSEWMRIDNHTPGIMSAKLDVIDYARRTLRTTGWIYVDRGCLDWGRYLAGSGCVYRGGFGVGEGWYVRLRLCVHTYHGAVCQTVYGRA